MSFEGRLDSARLAAARAGGADATVLTGTLRLDGKPLENLAFTWFGGD